jgi:hypothetical protein
MCRDDHVEIGHNDSSQERCPVCRERDRANSLEDVKRAVEEGRKRLDAAGVPKAGWTVCDDHSCQSQIGHRIRVLHLQMEDWRKCSDGFEELWKAGKQEKADLLTALQLIIRDLPTRRDWLDPVVEQMALDAIKKAKGELA